MLVFQVKLFATLARGNVVSSYVNQGTSMLQYNLCILMEFLHFFVYKKMILLDTIGATLIALLKIMAKISPWQLPCLF